MISSKNKSRTRMIVRLPLFALLLFLPFVSLNAQTSFVKDAGNPILPPGSPGAWDDAAVSYAHILFDGSTYQMWYSGAPSSSTYRVGYATSTDGLNWDKHPANPVLNIGAPGAFDDSEVWLPTVLFDGARYQMWYSGNLGSGGIGYATATDPAVWTRHGETPVLAGGGSGAWDEDAFNPVVIYSDSLYQMWYSGSPLTATGVVQTGYATSTDGVNWSKHPNNPVLMVGIGEWDEIFAGASTVLFVDGEYHMWYTGTRGNFFSNWAIGYAISPDGVTWTKHTGNPIVQRELGSWDSDIVGFPRVIKDGNRYRMWYTGRTASSINRLGYAEDSTVTSVKTMDDFAIPELFLLSHNYPNPFNPSTIINYDLRLAGQVELKVYNTLAYEVRTLVSSVRPVGSHQAMWDGRDSNGDKVPGGVYFYQLKAGSGVETRKMLMLK